MKMAITWTSEKRKFAPLVFTGNLEKSLENASVLGYQGIELSVRTGTDISTQRIKKALNKHEMEVSIVGTGLARAEDGLSFSDHNERIRQDAVERLKEQIDFASKLGAPVILGLIRGELDQDEVIKTNQLEWIIGCSRKCCAFARTTNVEIIVEPVNRYETNFLNTIEESVDFVKRIGLPNVGVMADTFHMNIEERDFAESLERAKKYLRYVHLADSNRLAPGFGHIDFQNVIHSLQKIGYDGYLSIECLPKPDPTIAAKQAIDHVTPLIF